MIDAEKLLGGLLRQSLGGGRRGRRRRKKSGLASLLGPGMAGAAGLGALGVAIAAFEHYTGKKSGTAAVPPGSPPPPVGDSGRPAMPPPPPLGNPVSTSPVPPVPPGSAAVNQVSESRALLLIHAMVAAANADGHIDSGEEQAILDYLEDGNLSAEEREFLHQLIDSPPSIDSLIPRVTDEELARQVYAVSELAIEVDTKAERDYLEYLKKRLGLATQ